MPGMLYGTTCRERPRDDRAALACRQLVRRQRRVRAPKSTLRAVICAIPAPEPVAEYVMLIPSALSTAGIHFEMSGNGNVAPVPTSEPVLRLRGRRLHALPASAATAATASSASRSHSALHDSFPFLSPAEVFE